MAHPKHESVRQLYDCRCGYCGISEADTGAELTVDHYHPLSAGGDESDENLVYACTKCNQYKGQFYPSANDLAHGRRVLHPLRGDVEQHLGEIAHAGYIKQLTETGRFHVALLQLNRPALVEHRLRRRLAALLAEKQRLLEKENAQLRETLAAQESYIAHLRQLLGFRSDESD